MPDPAYTLVCEEALENGFSTSVVKTLCRGCSSLRQSVHRLCFRSVVVRSGLPHSASGILLILAAPAGKNVRSTSPPSLTSSIGVKGLTCSDTGDELRIRLGVLSWSVLMYNVIVSRGACDRVFDVCIALASGIRCGELRDKLRVCRLRTDPFALMI